MNVACRLTKTFVRNPGAFNKTPTCESRSLKFLSLERLMRGFFCVKKENCKKVFAKFKEKIYNKPTDKITDKRKEKKVMNITITEKDIKATESIKEYIEKKVERLAKYFTEDFDVNVTMKAEGKDQVAEMQLTYEGASFRAITGHTDLYASIDKDIDILEGQIRKMKTKKDKQNMTESIRLKEETQLYAGEHEVQDEIVKTLYYEIKPISPEDAKLKLEERPQDRFLTFINVETGKVNVIYRLKDNKNFGLVEPEA